MNKVLSITLSLLCAGSILAVTPRKHDTQLKSGEITITNKGKKPATLRALYYKPSRFAEIPFFYKGFMDKKVDAGSSVNFSLINKKLGKLLYIDVVYGKKLTADLISAEDTQKIHQNSSPLEYTITDDKAWHVIK